MRSRLRLALAIACIPILFSLTFVGTSYGGYVALRSYIDPGFMSSASPADDIVVGLCIAGFGVLFGVLGSVTTWRTFQALRQPAETISAQATGPTNIKKLD
ncbi:MAG: hypothetical protein RIC55_16375 [Pirellulaceae bacterium]